MPSAPVSSTDSIHGASSSPVFPFLLGISIINPLPHNKSSLAKFEFHSSPLLPQARGLESRTETARCRCQLRAANTMHLPRPPRTWCSCPEFPPGSPWAWVVTKAGLLWLVVLVLWLLRRRRRSNNSRARSCCHSSRRWHPARDSTGRTTRYRFPHRWQAASNHCPRQPSPIYCSSRLCPHAVESA